METTSRPAATLSALEKLPTELIEKILLDVVADVKPPVVEDDGSRIFRCEKEIVADRSFASGFLAHRLTCRTLRNHAWRAFGKVIGHTIFDIPSRQSITALIEMSACKELAPWVKRLTVSCFALGGNDLFRGPNFSFGEFESRLDDASRAELVRLKDEELAWFHAAWVPMEPINQPPAQRCHSMEVDRESIAELQAIVSKCVKGLPNLNDVQYHHDEEYIPSRYKNVARRYQDDPEIYLCMDSSLERERGVSTGLHILLEAMGDACTRPKRLDLAVDLLEAHSFTTSALRDKISDVFNRVDTLTLKGSYHCRYYGTEWYQKGSPLVISNAMFPALRTLTVGNWYSDSPFPLPSGFPDLTTLTLFEASPNDPSLFAFLDKCKGSLRHIVFREMIPGTYRGILKTLQGFNLEVLEIRRFFDTWEEDEFDRPTASNIPKDLLYGAARSILITPTRFKNALESQWRQTGLGTSTRTS